MTYIDEIKNEIIAIWSDIENLDSAKAIPSIHKAINLLDSGEARVAEVIDGEVVVNQWLKHAILLLFKTSEMKLIESHPFTYLDKIPLKTVKPDGGVRLVPGASARWGSYLANGVTMMPSYVNIGAYVDEGTMVDTWATVGSCAQIGKNVHLSGGVGIGGVLEPAQAAPVVIEDDAFIGSRSMIVEGAWVKKGAKLGAGVILTSSTPVVDADSGEEISRGVVPERAVAVMGIREKEFTGGTFGLPCVLIIKTLEEGQIHDKLVLNSILREHGVAT
jgi:2,3,4,5-tetrahydropyridine-2-carboxylate N-succinyltransferase